jgi:hypothetical protein
MPVAFFLLTGTKLFATENQNPFGISFLVEDNQNLYEEKDLEKSHSLDFSLTPKYNAESYTISLSISGAKQLNLGEESSLANTTLNAFSKLQPTSLGESYMGGFGITAVLPTNSEQIRTTRFQGALSLGASLLHSTFFLKLPLTVSYSLSGAKNFHEYDLNGEGGPLTEFSLKNHFSFDLSFSEKFSFGLSLDYINGLTYRKSPREKFAANIELAYQLAKSTSLSTGVATEGNAKKVNGDDSNISFFNENNSVIHTGLAFVF